MGSVILRLQFAMKYHTVRRMVIDPRDPTQIAVYYKGKTIRLNRRCPHQGGPLEDGYIDGKDLVCPWHGCRYPLAASGPPRPYRPTSAG